MFANVVLACVKDFYAGILNLTYFDDIYLFSEGYTLFPTGRSQQNRHATHMKCSIPVRNHCLEHIISMQICKSIYLVQILRLYIRP